MSNQHRILVLYLLMCCVRVLSNNSQDPSDGQCSLQCTIPKLRRGELYSKCNISDPPKFKGCFEKFSFQVQNVSFLDLSGNNLNQVPSRMFPFCKNLTNLSLAQNNIKIIEPGAFKDLSHMRSLDLSFNDLREWKVSPNNEFESLNYLDVTDNEHWLPTSEQLLQMNNLTTIQGLTLTEYCQNCSLVKIKSNTAEDNSTSEWRGCSGSSLSEWQWHDQIQYGKALDFLKVGFVSTCLCDKKCLVDQYYIPYRQAISDIVVKVPFSLYATGSVALLVNVVVVLSIAFNKSLRGDLAVCLVLNVAICDILMSLFTLLYGQYNPIRMGTECYHYVLAENSDDCSSEVRKLRNIMGPILTCAVASQVFGSFILTFDKFLKIVFAMRPDARIGKRGAVFFVLLCWSFSATFAVLPVFEVGRMTYNLYADTVLFPVDFQSTLDSEASIGIATGSQIALIIVQIISLVLYIPIFIVATKSGANVGINREAAIAKKIALLVFTNLVFFTVPVLLGLFQTKSILWKTFGLPMSLNWQDYTLAQYQWFLFFNLSFPVLTLSINSVLNPFIYALRHPKIKQQLKAIISRCKIVLRERFVALRQHLHCHSNGDQQENDMEMQEVN